MKNSYVEGDTSTLSIVHSNSFPGSLMFPLASGGGKMRDPGNEVVVHCEVRLVPQPDCSPDQTEGKYSADISF